MKKRFLLPLLTAACIFAALALSACGEKNLMEGVLEEPEDNPLEFWLVDDVASFDFEGYSRRPGMGITGYFGKGYEVETYVDENGKTVRKEPEEYVLYGVTAYPDYVDGGSYVTQIEITDPKISVYGVSCTSTREEFESTFKALGFEINEEGRAIRGKTRVYFRENLLNIYVEIENRTGFAF